MIQSGNVGVPGAPPASVPKAGWYRWIVCGLLFFATTVNYLDRQVLAVLKPSLEKQLGWNQIDYSNIMIVFQLAYALGLVLMGRFIDRVGVRKGFMLAVILWSVAAIAHGFVAYIPHTMAVHFDKASASGSFWYFILYGTVNVLPILP